MSTNKILSLRFMTSDLFGMTTSDVMRGIFESFVNYSPSLLNFSQIQIGVRSFSTGKVFSLELVDDSHTVINPSTNNSSKVEKIGNNDCGLTPREIEVLKLLALGLQNKVIAYKMNVELGTIRTHIRNIFSKLEVHNKTAAVINALIHNYISISEIRDKNCSIDNTDL